MHPRQKRISSLAVSIFLTLFLAFVAIGQGTWSLGKYTFTGGPPSGPLEYNLASSGGLGSYGFVSGVGGVAFSGVASPGPAFKGQVIHLQYDNSALDGSRLQVTVGESILTGELPDWMLIPVARYANSRFDSCVSLFGPKTTDSKYDIVYHQEFEDTLIGLRLLQADMLLFDLAETWQLPKFGGTVVLGVGEIAPRRLDESSARQIEAALENANFQSWVLTDQGESIFFDGDHGHLRITGLPFYYFWTSDAETLQKQQDELYRQAQEAKRAGRVADHNRIAERINAMVPTVQEVGILSANLKNRREALRQFNAPVYDAATNVMRYSAFFRYVKNQDPSGWKDFMQQLKLVKIRPQIVTPTGWAR